MMQIDVSPSRFRRALFVNIIFFDGESMFSVEKKSRRYLMRKKKIWKIRSWRNLYMTEIVQSHYLYLYVIMRTFHCDNIIAFILYHQISFLVALSFEYKSIYLILCGWEQNTVICNTFDLVEYLDGFLFFIIFFCLV